MSCRLKRCLCRRALLRLGFLQLYASAIDDFNPAPLYSPRDQGFSDSLDVFPLYHNLLQIRIVKVRLHGCRRGARGLQPLGETLRVEAENLEAGYVSDGMVTGAANDVD